MNAAKITADADQLLQPQAGGAPQRICGHDRP